MGDGMDELDMARLGKALTGRDDTRVILSDLVGAAAGKDCYDWAARVQAVLRCKLRAGHRGADSIYKWMAHKIHRDARVAVDLLFKRKNHHHSLHQAFHNPHPPAPPGPSLRPPN